MMALSDGSNLSVPPELALQALIDNLRAAPNWQLVAKVIEQLDQSLSRGALDRDVRPTAIALEDAIVGLLSPPTNPTGFHLDGAAFDFPRLVSAWQIPLSHLEYWRAKHAQLSAEAARSDDHAGAASTVIGLLVCEALLKPSEAFAALLHRVDRLGPERFWQGLGNSGATILSVALRKTGCLAGDAANLRRACVLFEEIAAQRDSTIIAYWVLICLKSLFAEGMPGAVLDAIFETFVVGVLERAATRLDPVLLDAVQVLDERINSEYVKHVESTARFEQVQRAIAPLLERIGQAARAMIDTSAPEPGAQTGDPPRIGFVLASDSRLAHAENLITLLRGLAAMRAQAIEPLVYILAPTAANSPLVERIHATGTRTRTTITAAAHPIVWLHRMTREDRIHTLVFISSAAYISFAVGYGTAPVAVWWTMKYHVKAVARADGYLSCGNFFDTGMTVRGETWRGCRAALPPLTDPSAAAKGATLRAKLGWTNQHVVIGCIGREEKLLNPAYFQALSAIMAEHPDARFLWTGRAGRAGEVQRLIDQADLASRCTFIGWVKDTKVAAAALDVYADSFPFASGHTAFEAMAAGKPVVVLKSPEALESSTLTNLAPVYEGTIGSPRDQAEVRAMFTGPDGGSLLPVANDVSEYRALLGRLIGDAGFRAKVGAAGRNFVERFARDEATFAETTCRHLIDITLAKTVPRPHA